MSTRIELRLLPPLLVSLLLVSCAQPAVQPESPESQQLASAEDDLVCKHEQQIGTRFTKKTCYTHEQWVAMLDARRQAQQEAGIEGQPPGALRLESPPDPIYGEINDTY